MPLRRHLRRWLRGGRVASGAAPRRPPALPWRWSSSCVRQAPRSLWTPTGSSGWSCSAPGRGASHTAQKDQHPSETADKAPGFSADPKAETGRAYQQVHAQMERITQMYRNVEVSTQTAQYMLGIAAAVVGLGSGYLIYNWRRVRSEVSRESAEVISETIRDKRLQFSAQEFSKELLNHMLNDEDVAKLVSKWIYDLLVTLQYEIGALVVRILHQEQVIEAVNRLADRLVAYLCSSESIQQRVGQLLVDAICLRSSRDAAAEWAYDLVLRDDVTCGFRDLVVTTLQMDAVIGEARELAVLVVNRVLQDPDTISEAKRALGQTLKDAELRATAKESLWNIVSPWPFGTSSPRPGQRALKSVDELLFLETLTQEERQMLKSLQARIRSGGSSSTPPSATGPVDVPAAVPDKVQSDAASNPPSAEATAAPDPQRPATAVSSEPAEDKGSPPGAAAAAPVSRQVSAPKTAEGQPSAAPPGGESGPPAPP